MTDIEETYASGLSNRTLTMVYDDANRLTEENITVSGTLTSTTYDYDAADNRTERTMTIGGGLRIRRPTPTTASIN